MFVFQLHREGSLVIVHNKDDNIADQRQPLSVLTSVEGDNGTVISCDNREPQSVRILL